MICLLIRICSLNIGNNVCYYYILFKIVVIFRERFISIFIFLDYEGFGKNIIFYLK